MRVGLGSPAEPAELKHDASAVGNSEATVLARVSQPASTAAGTEPGADSGSGRAAIPLGYVRDSPTRKHGVGSDDATGVQSLLDHRGPAESSGVSPPASPSPEWQLHLHRSPGFVDATQETVDGSCLAKEAMAAPAPPGYLRFAYLIQTNLKKLGVAPLVYATTEATRLPDGEVLEFGVYSGGSITRTATALAPKVIHGFDSFEGLPEKWVRKDNNALVRTASGRDALLPCC